MSDPVKIIVTTETRQAGAALAALGATGAASLRQVREAALLTHEGLRGLEGTALLLGGTRFPELTTGIMTAVAGMRALRTASMLSKIPMAEMVPVIGGIAAAVGLGFLAWREWGNETAKATERAKEMADALEKIPGVLDKISAAQKAGRLTDDEAGSLQNILAGRRQMYRKAGSYDPASGHWDLTELERSQITTGRMRGNYRQNEPADSSDLVNYAQQVLKSKGAMMANGKDDPTIEGENKLKELMRSVSEEALSGYAKERAAADDKYEKDLAELKTYANNAKLSAQEIAEKKGQIDQAYATKKQQITDKENADLQKNYDAYLQEEASTEKQITEELAKQAQLKQEIMRAHVEAQLKSIEGNPFLSAQEKASKSVPFDQEMISQNNTRLTQLQGIAGSTTDAIASLEAQKQITELIAQQAELQNKLLKDQATGTFWGTYKMNLAQLKTQWGSLSTNLANGAFQLIQQGVSGMANALTSLIMGTKTAGQAFAEFGLSLLTSFIEMILEMILYAEVAIPILTSLGVLSGGTTAATGSAVTIAAVGAAMSVAAFAEGGRPAIGEFALVGERGPELFVPDSAGTIYSAEQTGTMMARPRYSDAGGSPSAGGSSKPNTQVLFFMDRQELLNHLKSTDAKEVILAHVANNKMRVGINT